MPHQDEPRIVNAAGLRLPMRESIVVLVTTLVLVIDYYHPLALLNLPIGPAASTAIARIALYLVVPLLTLLLLGERPTEYGLRIGDWRVGLANLRVHVLRRPRLRLARLADPLRPVRRAPARVHHQLVIFVASG